MSSIAAADNRLGAETAGAAAARQGCGHQQHQGDGSNPQAGLQGAEAE